MIDRPPRTADEATAAARIVATLCGCTCTPTVEILRDDDGFAFPGIVRHTSVCQLLIIQRKKAP